MSVGVLGRASGGALPMVLIRAHRGLLDIDLRAIWQGRELLYFLVWRTLRLRYRQTALGVTWALIQPLATMVVFTVIFGRLAKISSDGLPYAVFAYTALLPWSYFAQALGRSWSSLVGDADLVTKIYFPRVLIPLHAVLVPLVDLAISGVVLAAMLLWFGFVPGWRVLAVPGLLLLAMGAALAAGLYLSALHVRYRDVGYAAPFLLQFWLYASPVVYPMSLVPERWRTLYSLNPMVTVIEGFRWALLGGRGVSWTVVGVSTATVLVFLGGGIIFFHRMEATLADAI